MGAKRFTDLIVWQKAYELSLKIHQMTKTFPAEERYRLKDPMCRAAATIPRNITEGFGRATPRDQAYFYTVAKSSADEVGAMLYVLRRRVLATGTRRT